MRLHQALRVLRGDVVAFTGAGGKTSALITLGHELAEAGWRVLATTTLPVNAEQLDLPPASVRCAAGFDAISNALTAHRFVFLYDHVSSGSAYGPPLAWVTRLLDAVDSDVLLIEADTARALPMKAPGADEPVIPPETSLVVPVVSLVVLGKPLDEAHVYNAPAIMARYGFTEGARVRSPWVAQVLRDETLGLRGVPAQARVVGLINGTPASGYFRGRARAIAQWALRSSRFEGIAIGSVRGAVPVHEVQRHIGAVVLAAGMSTRMGQPKVLLPWAEGRTIIEHILHQLILSKLDHITVVTGHLSREVTAQVKPYAVQTVYNRAFRTGEMLSSLKAGLRALPAHVTAALVVLGDQPRIQPRVVMQVLMAYAEGRGEIIVPSYEMRRGHPILLDRRCWHEILDLPEDGSLRDVIYAHAEQIAYVAVDTDSVLRDVDTPQDYDDERQRAGL